MIDDKRIAAVIVAAGKGLRMGTDVPKQYMQLEEMTILERTVAVFEASCADDIVIICPPGDEDYVSRTILKDRYGKVRSVKAGGSERFRSCGIGVEEAATAAYGGEKPDYILIHDGVRALVTPELIEVVARALLMYPAVCPGVPVKDTVRMVGTDSVATDVLPRQQLRIVQTPQGFKTDLIVEAYRRFAAEAAEGTACDITDDAMLVEKYMSQPVYMAEGSYENIKITTPDDLMLAGMLIKRR